jgi:hypothetical protein
MLQVVPAPEVMLVWLPLEWLLLLLLHLAFWQPPSA